MNFKRFAAGLLAAGMSLSALGAGAIAPDLENAGIDFLHNIFRLFFALYKDCIGAVDMTCGDGFKSVKLIPCCKFRKNKRKNLICHIEYPPKIDIKN